MSLPISIRADGSVNAVTIGAVTILFSYDTAVAFRLNDGSGFRDPTKYSKTTSKHLNQSTVGQVPEAASRDAFERALAAALTPAAPAGDPPWGDCKVAFDVEDHNALWDAEDRGGLNLPRGWKLNETDTSGARAVAVFRVEGVPTVAAGALVAEEIARIDGGGR